MRKKPLAIYGAGGLGRELKSWIVKLQEYNLVGFFDDGLPAGSRVDDVPILGDASSVSKIYPGELNIIIAIGNPLQKCRVGETLSTLSSVKFPAIIHPNAVLDNINSISIGEGTIITAGCILTTHVTLGKHVLINLNATIGHDCEIGNFASIMPGVNLSGGVKIGKNVLIGAGANLLNRVSVGENSKVGAGAVVLNDLPENCTAVGVPAKIIDA